MDRLESMKVLTAVVDAGSLSAAGRTLGMPLATVSRKVSELEAALNTRLLLRTTRQLALTEAGRGYVEACRRILEDVSAAERNAAGEYLAPRGELVLTAPVVFGRLHVVPILVEFLQAFPEINVHLELGDRNVNLLDEHIDVALRIGALPDSGMVATAVGSIRRIACASPAYLAKAGTPRHPRELHTHSCVSFEALAAGDAWRFREHGAELLVPIAPRLTVSTAEAAIDAAIAGLGVTCVLSYQVETALRAGTLAVVLQDFEPAPIPIHLVYSSHGRLPLKLRALLDFAAPRLRARLQQGAQAIQALHPPAPASRAGRASPEPAARLHQPHWLADRRPGIYAAAAVTSAEADLFEILSWADLLAAAPAPFAQSIGLEVREVGGATACVAPGIPTLEFNRAVGLGMRRPARDDDVAALLDFYRSRGTKTGAIQTIEGSTAPEVEGWLRAQGSSPLPRRWVVLSRDTAPAQPVPTSLQIAEVGPERAAAAAEAFCAGYGTPPPMAGWIAKLVGRPRWRCFCAFDGARIVSTSFLFLDQGRAQLAGAGTLREARGQGAQGALMAARIEAARAAGVRVVQSHTGLPLGDEPSPSLDNMHRVGLKDLHIRTNWSVAAGAASPGSKVPGAR